MQIKLHEPWFHKSAVRSNLQNIAWLLAQSKESRPHLPFPLNLEDRQSSQRRATVDHPLVEQKTRPLADQGNGVLYLHVSRLGIVNYVVFEVPLMGVLGHDSAVH